MVILDVIPMASLPRPHGDILSYYNSETVEPGKFVSLKFGNRKISGIVVANRDIKNAKLILKKRSDFSLKKIESVQEYIPMVQSWQLKIAKYISQEYFSPIGLTMRTIIPDFWQIKKYSSQIKSHRLSKTNRTTSENTISTSVRDHAANFRAKIEHVNNVGKQVFLLVPEKSYIDYFQRAFHDLEPLIIHSGLSNAKRFDAWQSIQSGSVKLIIGTRIGLFSPFKDLGLLIVDDETNDAYKSDMTPRYDSVGLAKFIANLHVSNMIIGASVPHLRSDIIIPRSMGNIEIIDSVKEIRDANRSVISRKLKAALLNAVDKSQNTIIHVPRKGHASFLKCSTCSHAASCDNCSTPMSVYKQPREHLLCHKCTAERKYPKQCESCQSYTLKPFGFGTGKIHKDIERFFTFGNMDIPMIIPFDTDSTPTYSDQKNALLKFSKTKPSILLATNLIYSHKYWTHVPVIGIINADILMHVPDFRASENLFRQIVTASQMTDRLLVQTYVPDNKSLLAATGDAEFLSRELSERKQLSYPPFTRLTKLSFRDINLSAAKSEATRISSILKKSVGDDLKLVGPYASFIAKEKGKYTYNVLIKSNDKSINRNHILHLIPNNWKIDVDPTNIL